MTRTRVLVVVLLARCVAGTPSLLLSSPVEDKVIFEAMGVYKPDGEAFGETRYRLESEAISRYLYRSKKGQWTITGNEANIAVSKGTIVSTSSVASPVGATFRYYYDKKWKEDSTLVVSELPSEEEAQENADSVIDQPDEESSPSAEFVAHPASDADSVSYLATGEASGNENGDTTTSENDIAPSLNTHSTANPDIVHTEEASEGDVGTSDTENKATTPEKIPEALDQQPPDLADNLDEETGGDSQEQSEAESRIEAEAVPVSAENSDSKTADNSDVETTGQYLSCHKAMGSDFEGMSEEEMMTCVNILNPEFGTLLETEAAAVSSAETTAGVSQNESDCASTLVMCHMGLAASLTLFFVSVVLHLLRRKSPSKVVEEGLKQAPPSSNVLLEKDVGAALKQTILKPHLDKNAALQTELDKLTSLLNKHSAEKAEVDKKLQAALADVSDARKSKTTAILESETKHQTVISQLQKTKSANEKLQRELSEAKGAGIAAVKEQSKRDIEILMKERERFSADLAAKEKEAQVALAQAASLGAELKALKGDVASAAKADEASARAAAASLQDELRATRETADEQRRMIAELKAEVAGVKTAWAQGMKAQSKRNAEAFAKQTEELKGKVRDLDAAEGRVEALSAEVKALQDELGTARESAAAGKEAEDRAKALRELQARLEEANLLNERLASEARAAEEAALAEKERGAAREGDLRRAVGELDEARKETGAAKQQQGRQVEELREQLKRSAEEVAASLTLAAADRDTIASLEEALREAKATWAAQLKDASKRHADALAAAKEEGSSFLAASQQRRAAELEAAVAAARAEWEETAKAQSGKELAEVGEEHRAELQRALNKAAAAEAVLQEVKEDADEAAARVSALSADKKAAELRADALAQQVEEAAQRREASGGSRRDHPTEEEGELARALAQAKAEAEELKAGKQRAEAEVNTLETKLLMANASSAAGGGASSGDDGAGLAKTLQSVQDENAALKEMLKSKETLAEENAELKEALQRRTLAQADATHATESLHEEAMLGLQKTMATLAEELEESTRSGAEARAERDAAVAALEAKQEELDELRTTATVHASELEASREESEGATGKIASLEAQVSALNALVEMKAASAPTSSAAADADLGATALAQALLHAGGGDASASVLSTTGGAEEEEEEGEGELTMDLTSFLDGDTVGDDPDEW